MPGSQSHPRKDLGTPLQETGCRFLGKALLNFFPRERTGGGLEGRGVSPDPQCWVCQEGGCWVHVLCWQSLRSLHIDGSEFWLLKLQALEKGAYFIFSYS